MSIAVMNVLRAYEVYTPRRSAVTSRVSRAEEKNDMVALSTQARDFHAIKRALEGVPDIREEKIKPIKQQLDTDQYQINAHLIAEKMMSGRGSL